MKGKLFILAGFLVLAWSGIAQEATLKITDSIPGKYDRFSVDNLGRIYVTNSDVVIQFSAECDTLFSASIKSFRPSSIESSKTFRTLIFDEERSVIHFLDNTLTDIHGEIDLVGLDIQQPVLVCESFAGNTIWVLDAGTLRLVKLNENLEKVIIIENLISLFEDNAIPSKMMESNDFLYILVPGKGVAIFDVFGTYIKMYPTKATQIDVHSKYLLLRKDRKIEVIDARELMEPVFTYTIPDKVIDFAFVKQKVYFLTKEGLKIGAYQVKEK